VWISPLFRLGIIIRRLNVDPEPLYPILITLVVGMAAIVAGIVIWRRGRAEPALLSSKRV
jgi:hypothetical protein